MVLHAGWLRFIAVECTEPTQFRPETEDVPVSVLPQEAQVKPVAIFPNDALCTSLTGGRMRPILYQSLQPTQQPSTSLIKDVPLPQITNGLLPTL